MRFTARVWSESQESWAAAECVVQERHAAARGSEWQRSELAVEVRAPSELPAPAGGGEVEVLLAVEVPAGGEPEWTPQLAHLTAEGAWVGSK